MWPVVLSIVVGALLIIHGVAHVDITRVWGSRESASSWLLGDAGGVGTGLATIAPAGFVLAGLGVFIGLGVWRPLAIAAACASLITIALFWDPKMVLGVAIDLAILAALLWASWPEDDAFGFGHG